MAHCPGLKSEANRLVVETMTASNDKETTIIVDMDARMGVIGV